MRVFENDSVIDVKYTPQSCNRIGKTHLKGTALSDGEMNASLFPKASNKDKVDRRKLLVQFNLLTGKVIDLVRLKQIDRTHFP